MTNKSTKYQINSIIRKLVTNNQLIRVNNVISVPNYKLPMSTIESINIYLPLHNIVFACSVIQPYLFIIIIGIMLLGEGDVWY